MNPQFRPARRDRRHRRARHLAALLGAIAIGTTVAACGSSSSSSSSAGSATSASNAASTGSTTGASTGGVAIADAKLKQYEATPTKIIHTQSLTSAPPSGKTLVMLGTSDPGNVVIQKGLADMAKLAHWNYSQVSYDPANIGTFNAAVDSALTKHPNYVAEAGLPLTSQALQKVQSAGAKWVITAVCPVIVKPPIIAASNGCANDAEMGRVLAYYFVSDSGGKGNAVIEHVPAYPVLTAFTSAFTSTVKALCPSCKTQIVNITIPDLSAGKIPSTMVSALKSNPAANYLVFDYGPFAEGINSALNAAGLGGKVKIIGQAADSGAIAALKSGQQAAWTGFDPGYQPYAMFDAMFRDLAGLPINQTEQAQQPTQILTKSNINSVNVKDGFWSEPADALSQFETLWHLQ
jgi:ribose transport system substrate-binding protein